ncbi:Zinc finger FYVE domain-containing protein 1 [Heterocephalus glaber]|uniref:Zinc finger FYVE domain-containing protein 1 n=1 Tax=Heterocephalus glaber TaxID=10181 RepID=G5BXQ1_HETGA|nr:Zinc finger FYVE domain-containing protein 1 [Heterocephalus glaber]
MVTVLDIPLGLVKDAARPVHWVPDHKILHCHNCRKEFSVKLSKHHCQACGQGFCDEWSHDRWAVPSRSRDHPV